MNHSHRVSISVFCFLTVLIAFSGLFPAEVSAWDNHFRLTETILKSVDWLSKYDEIEITPMAYEVDPVNPSYEFLFKEGVPGETTNALAILSTYCDEPDWGMDLNMRLSWQQTFMGGYEGTGSQGYIHLYYPAGSFSLPLIVAPMGMTPKRVDHIFELVTEALSRGDLYWAFRFSAWCIHYLEDMSMPYHTAQTSKLFYWLKDGPKQIISGTTTITGNYHFAYEAFSDYYLKLAMEGREVPQFIEILQENTTFEPMSPRKLVKKVARKSHSQSKDSFVASREFFGDKFFTAEKIEAGVDDFILEGPGNTREKLFSTIASSFGLAGKAVRTYCSILQKTMNPENGEKSENFRELYQRQ